MQLHAWIGIEQSNYLCLRAHQGKPCPICREAMRAQQAGEEEEKKKLQAQTRHLAYILDRDGDDPTVPHIFSMSYTQDKDIAAVCWDRKTGEDLWLDDPDQGFDLAFDRAGTGIKTRYSGYRVDRSPSPLFPNPRKQAEILDWVADHPIPDLLQFYPPEVLERAISMVGDATDDNGRGHDLLHTPSRGRYDDDDDDSAPPSRGRYEEPVEEEETPDEVDTGPTEEELEPPPPRPSRRSAPRETMRKPDFVTPPLREPFRRPR